MVFSKKAKEKPASSLHSAAKSDRSKTPGRGRLAFILNKERGQKFLEELNYPHNIHPALVPGVSIEDQKVRYGVDRVIVAVVGVLIISFVVWGALQPQTVFDVSSTALNWIMVNFGWVFTVIAAGLVVVLLWLAFSRYGKIPLGLDGEAPEFSTSSWVAMLFAGGIGIGIIFFGAYEPLTFYLSPRPGTVEPASAEAITAAMSQSAMHWGINAWSIYAIVGLAVAYTSFRRGRVPLMSSILAPLFKTDVTNPGMRAIDGMAIIATLFGTAASLGIGAMQIARGVEIVTGWSTEGNQIAIVVIMLLTIGTIISAVSGVAKGIRMLSNINMVLALGLAIFIFFVGPSAFIMNAIPSVMIDYLANIPDALSANMAASPEMQAFLSSWTVFYWAWWVSWAPFVGVFVAKISRGRTIRQFVLGVLFIPSTIVIAAFTVIGGTAIWMQRETQALAPGNDPNALPAPAEIMFEVLSNLPGYAIVAPLIIVILAVFFITSADSASLVNSQLSQRGNPSPKRLITAFWAVCMAGIAVVMLLAGGADVLQGLQNMITITALPFAVVLILMTVALVKELRNDPMTIRSNFEQSALEKAVVAGVTEYGDNFKIALEPTASDDELAAGADFDSEAPEVTDWYARTDEDGNPVDYDYEAGQYLDANGTPLVDETADSDTVKTTDGAE
ncbi:BCCT family transporter [Canibacter zhoujuaniae]|uniref:BCCT family transporter n=1 Tax=Canibacter zhoujuaniae TaxID=2708343 RepID=UPI00141FECDE|nr:BCCT family transporter [Canibacter zhoujuaniae]